MNNKLLHLSLNLCFRLLFDENSKWCTLPENVNCDTRTFNLQTITTNFCKWYGKVIDRNGSSIKSLCYHDAQLTHEEASNNCKKHGMRLMRIESFSVQTGTLNYLKLRFDKEMNGEYHVNGININGTWYHDDNTLVYANIPWRAGKIPASGFLALRNVIPMEFTSYPNTKKLHSICDTMNSLNLQQLITFNFYHITINFTKDPHPFVNKTNCNHVLVVR